MAYTKPKHRGEIREIRRPSDYYDYDRIKRALCLGQNF